MCAEPAEENSDQQTKPENNTSTTADDSIEIVQLQNPPKQKNTKSFKFDGLTISTIALVVVTGVLCYYTRLLWLDAASQSENNKTIAEAAKISADAAKISAEAAIESNSLNKQIANTNEIAIRLQLQPIIGLDSISVPFFEINKPVTLDITVSNRGVTPAYNVFYYTETGIRKEIDMIKIDSAEKAQRLSKTPRNTVVAIFNVHENQKFRQTTDWVVSESNFKTVMGGTEKLYCFIRYRYDQKFGSRIFHKTFEYSAYYDFRFGAWIQTASNAD